MENVLISISSCLMKSKYGKKTFATVWKAHHKKTVGAQFSKAAQAFTTNLEPFTRIFFGTPTKILSERTLTTDQNQYLKL